MDELPSEKIGLAAEVQAVLMEKIKRLEGELKRARFIAEEAERNTIGRVLRSLRARETVLLYFGEQSANEYTATMREAFSEEIVRHVMRDVFFVSGSPLKSEQQEALRVALSERWFPR
ncbi:hypothetical protein [Burkholderia stagnalis]|uniref:hypothetical protein n=1 Tax=Burkholderia stagnalis TaxID=1503054 RepID=UPI00075FFB41|nr:hypothetical protein [Burkholderia stagnalis]KWN83011.1 hypothetical protein WT91_29635 [Burkholderia stagnalis]KWN96030.1 hypothetical protein WT92_16215 [Burkholderia stagnalis]